MSPGKVQSSVFIGRRLKVRNCRGGTRLASVLVGMVTILMLAAVFMFGFSIFSGSTVPVALQTGKSASASGSDNSKPKQLVAYLQKVERHVQSKYIEPPDIHKAKDKVKIRLRISRDGNPLGFQLMQSSQDFDIDKYIVKTLIHQAYPAPTFKVDNKGVSALFTVEGRRISVTVP